MKKEVKNYLVASSVLIGSCIGGGVLGLPYVAAKSGFFLTLIYIIGVGGLIYLVNSFLGEVILRTKGKHQLIGYTERYLGRNAKHIMEFAVVFGVYSAIVAFLVGMGQSFSFIFFNSAKYMIPFGILAGIFVSLILKGGLNALKKYEKYGVLVVLSLLIVIVSIFMPKVAVENLMNFDPAYVLFPFGVTLFALKSFDAIPEVRMILKGNEKNFRKVLLTAISVAVVFYILFTFVVLGYMGEGTPQVATLSLGRVFVFLGIFTMFTSYLVMGDALCESFQFDERYTKKHSWMIATWVPIGLFVLTQLTDFFSFTRILSIGGVVSGGIIAIMSLLMVDKAKKHGNRTPEYSVKSHWYIMVILIAIFALGVIIELFK